jgi:hypothetical protein
VGEKKELSDNRDITTVGIATLVNVYVLMEDL